MLAPNPGARELIWKRKERAANSYPPMFDKESPDYDRGHQTVCWQHWHDGTLRRNPQWKKQHVPSVKLMEEKNIAPNDKRIYFHSFWAERPHQLQSFAGRLWQRIQICALRPRKRSAAPYSPRAGKPPVWKGKTGGGWTLIIKEKKRRGINAESLTNSRHSFTLNLSTRFFWKIAQNPIFAAKLFLC